MGDVSEDTEQPIFFITAFSLYVLPLSCMCVFIYILLLIYKNKIIFLFLQIHNNT